jgi:glucose/arabinose dehydrogenase
MDCGPPSTRRPARSGLSRIAVTAALGLPLFGVHAAAVSSTAATSGQRVAVSLVDFRIRPAIAHVAPGRVTFAVTNHGTVIHDLVVTGVGRTRILERGQQQTLTLDLRKPGIYRLYCSVPGHAALGMVATLRVGEAGAPGKNAPHHVAGSSSGALVQLTPVANVGDGVTAITSPPDQPDDLVVASQDGLVSIVRDGEREPRPFLDLRDRVRENGENGLLSVAFAPDYATSGLLYADYSDLNANLHVTEFRRSAQDADTADPGSARELLGIVKPTPDHNGGMLQFGPDGDLYIAVGDGGADPPTIPIGIYGQTLDDLFGSILRIDPRHGDPYAIPAGNPFAAVPDVRPEIVAYGLRNPWRFWIDARTDTMLIGDVGEDSREEIDRLPLDRLGLDFGWPCEEGAVVPPGVQIPAACAGAALVPPLYSYRHSATRCSIIGGVVVRDPRLPQLDGRYVWSDLCESHVLEVDPNSSKPEEAVLASVAGHPTTFGVDGRGRVYLGTSTGGVYRLDPAPVARAR